MNKLEKYKPAVMNSLLLFLAGIVWMGVGIMLLCIAILWLSAAPNSHAYLKAGTGVIIALLVHHFGFLRIVDTNLERILQTDDKKCVFSFIPWKSYLIIGIMITLGSILRHSVIPKSYLSIVYIGIGLALLLSSIRYMRFYYIEIRKKSREDISCPPMGPSSGVRK